MLSVTTLVLPSILGNSGFHVLSLDAYQPLTFHRCPLWTLCFSQIMLKMHCIWHVQLQIQGCACSSSFLKALLAPLQIFISYSCIQMQFLSQLHKIFWSAVHHSFIPPFPHPEFLWLHHLFSQISLLLHQSWMSMCCAIYPHIDLVFHVLFLLVPRTILTCN